MFGDVVARLVSLSRFIEMSNFEIVLHFGFRRQANAY